MMLFVAGAFAQEIPWDACPSVVTAADASPYRDTDLGLGALYSALHALVAPYAPDSCAWVETTEEDTTSDVATSRTERICSGTGFTTTITTTSTWYTDAYTEYVATDETSTVTEVDSGETWSRIELVWSSYVTEELSRASRDASWTGSVAGIPDDGSFQVSSSEVFSMYEDSEELRLVTPGCSISWSEWLVDFPAESVHLDARSVTVAYLAPYGCADGPVATIDGTVTGLVDMDSWERDYSDADGDGYTPRCDCDDGDTTVHRYATEIPDDGIDQDCDAADALSDADGDGYDDPVYGGADCDNTDATAYPLAPEVAGDGIDQDCDGADDIDADADGFTADGDARDPDCDDADASVYPLATEVECDGIDQDCDGADTCPPPDLPEDTGTHEEEEPAEEEDTALPEEDAGCTGSAAFLLFAPLLGLRRKGSR